MPPKQKKTKTPTKSSTKQKKTETPTNLDDINITPANKKRIRTLHKNTFQDMKFNKTWMNKNMKRIEETIETTYSKDKPSTKCSYYSSLAMLAQDLGGDDDKAYQRFSKLSTDYAVKHQAKRKTGELSEAEEKNIHSFENYSIHREIEYQKWQDDKKDETKMYRSLVMSLLTMYVPLRRSDYLNLKLVEELPKKSTKDNFLKYHTGSMKCSIVLNTPSKCKAHEIALKAGEYPFSLLLSKRIIETITAFPRTWLFSMIGKPKQAMTEGSFYCILDGIYKEQVVRPSYLRTAYETFVTRQAFSTTFRENISKLLLHDLTTAMKFYNRKNIKIEAENDSYNLTLCYVEANGKTEFANEVGDIPDYSYEYVFLLVGKKRVDPKLSDKKIEKLNERVDEIEDELNKVEQNPTAKPKYRVNLIFDDDDDEPEPVVNHVEPIPEPVPEVPKSVNFEKASRPPAPKPIEKSQQVTNEPVVQKTEPKQTKSSKNAIAVQKYLSKDGNRFKHQQLDYCAKLSKGIITHPKESTIKKYNIFYDEQTKQYKCK